MTTNFATNIAPLTINECARLIRTVGEHVTVYIESEPGCGKSSILKVLAEQMGDAYEYVYLDCPTLGDGDLGMNIPNRETGQLEFFVSSLLKLDAGKPVVIMADEVAKMSNLLKVIITRLFLERAIGDRVLPAGSIVFATSNHGSDGVGDTLQAHIGNRIMRVEMAKPDHKSWCAWAGEHGVSALTRAWVTMKPKALHSYRHITAEELRDNEFIFNPSRPATTFVSPRSLEKADVVVRNRDILGDTVTKTALAGVVGAAAAESMAMFFKLEKDLLSVPAILRDPEGITLPTQVGAVLMTLFNAVDELETQDQLVKFMRFTARLDSEEFRAVFFTMLCESKRTARMAMQNAEVKAWYLANHKLVS